MQNSQVLKKNSQLLNKREGAWSLRHFKYLSWGYYVEVVDKMNKIGKQKKYFTLLEDFFPLHQG